MEIAFGAEIGVWVWCGDQCWAMGLLWVLFGFVMGCVGSYQRGFLLVVVGVGFGGWNGGGMVLGTMIMVVVASRCCGGGWVFSLGGPQFPRFLWRLVELLWRLGRQWKYWISACGFFVVEVLALGLICIDFCRFFIFWLFGWWRWFGFGGREIKIRERREMGESSWDILFYLVDILF